MGEIVNLHRMKKRREREEAAAVAKQNRVRHGAHRDREGERRRASRQQRRRCWMPHGAAKRANEPPRTR